MFMLPEAYVVAVAVWAGWTPVSLLLVTPSLAAIHGLAVVLGVISLTAPTLAAAVYLLRRRRSARLPLLYATIITGAVLGAASGSDWLILLYAHQALLIGLLWLPRVDAVLSVTYRDQVMPATPLILRSRRAAWTCGFLVAMFASGVAMVFALAHVG